MKGTYIKSAVILLLCMTGISVRAQWKATAGPYGGYVYTSASNSTALFAGIEDGLYRSFDMGKSWKRVSESFGADGWVNAIAATDSLVVAGTWLGTVFISSDGGSTWANTGAPHSQTFITDAAISGSDIFVSTPFGLYRSSNRGSSWTEQNNGPGAPIIGHILADGPRLFAESGGISVTTDRGESWTSSFSWVSVQALGKSGGAILAGTGGSGIYRSTDHGGSWNRSSEETAGSEVVAFCKTTNALYAASPGYNHEMYKSTDDGEHWSTIDVAASLPTVYTLTSRGAAAFAGTERGVFVSTDGVGWSHADSGLGRASLGTISANRQSVLTGGFGAFLSTDAGAHWKAIDRGLMFNYVNDFAIRDTVFFAATAGGVYRTTLNAPVWLPAAGGLPDPTSASSIANSGTVLFIGAAPGGVYRSNDDGLTWSAASNGLTESYVHSLAWFDSSLWAGTDNGVFVSRDLGDSWKPVNSGWTKPWVGSIVGNGNRLYAGTGDGIYVTGTSQVYWSGVSAPFTLPVYRLRIAANQLFAATASGFYAATAMGTHWVESNDGLTITDAISLAVVDSVIYLMTAEGTVWKRGVAEIVTAVPRQERERPARFSLSQNYPNPFNPATTIRYAVPQTSLVRLAVYDVLGREVSVLVNDEQEMGNWEVTFDGSRLASGVYYYRLRAGEFVETRKFLLLR